MRIGKHRGAAALSLALAWLTAAGGEARADTVLPALGGPGGATFSFRCSNDWILTGVEVRIKDDIHAVRPLCARPFGGSLADWPRLTSGSGIIFLPGLIPIPRVAPGWFGDPRGHIDHVICPPFAPIMHGWKVGVGGSDERVVRSFELLCGGMQPTSASPARWGNNITSPGTRLLMMPWGQVIQVQAGQSTYEQLCPSGQIAVGLHGRSGLLLDAAGLICSAPRRARPSTYSAQLSAGRPVVALGPVGGSAGVAPARSICDRAAAARARGSPAAPGLERQCEAYRAANPPVALGRSGPTASDDLPRSICELARDARERGSPAAPALEDRCYALWNTPGAMADTVELDALAARGALAAAGDPYAAALRERQPPSHRRGFDVAMASQHDTAWGPGKQRLLDSLPLDEVDGFRTAIAYLFARNRRASRED
jgi:hypothetical protein